MFIKNFFLLGAIIVGFSSHLLAMESGDVSFKRQNRWDKVRFIERIGNTQAQWTLLRARMSFWVATDLFKEETDYLAELDCPAYKYLDLLTMATVEDRDYEICWWNKVGGKLLKRLPLYLKHFESLFRLLEIYDELYEKIQDQLGKPIIQVLAPVGRGIIPRIIEVFCDDGSEEEYFKEE